MTDYPCSRVMNARIIQAASCRHIYEKEYGLHCAALNEKDLHNKESDPFVTHIIKHAYLVVNPGFLNSFMYHISFP